MIREMRLDGAFFRDDILTLLDEHHVEYAIKVPFHPWIGLTERILKQQCWGRVHELINRAGRLVNSAGKAVLEIGANPALLASFKNYERSARNEL